MAFIQDIQEVLLDSVNMLHVATICVPSKCYTFLRKIPSTIFAHGRLIG